jgi:hypothetical protein
VQNTNGLLIAGLCCLGPLCLAMISGLAVRVLRGVFRFFAGS